jgi:hypothetical protein
MTIKARLEALEAQRSAPRVFTHYPNDDHAIECGTGAHVALADVPNDCTLIEIVYASKAVPHGEH